MSDNPAVISVGTVPVRGERAGGWQRWVPYAAVAWSLAYGFLAIFWAVSGLGFPYSSSATSISLGPLMGRFGSVTD